MVGTTTTPFVKTPVSCDRKIIFFLLNDSDYVGNRPNGNRGHMISKWRLLTSDSVAKNRLRHLVSVPWSSGHEFSIYCNYKLYNAVLQRRTLDVVC